jgi:hypothetical protein
MPLLAQDLTAADQSRLVSFWRSVPAWRRIQIIGELHEAADLLALSDLRRRFPNDTPEQSRARLAARRRQLEHL